MNPANFPGRKLRRQLRADMPKGEKTEPEIPVGTRNHKSKVRRPQGWRRGKA